MSTDFDIKFFLCENGYSDTIDIALQILYDHNLTNPSKARMADYKKKLALQLLKDSLIITCTYAQCLDFAKKSGKFRVPAFHPQDCESCGGSYNAHAVNEMVVMAKNKKIEKLVIVGGESKQGELVTLINNRLQLKLIDGKRKRTLGQALIDMSWGHIVAIWCRTELLHSTSELYTKHPRTLIVIVPRSGIVALAETLTQNIKRIR
jgi:ribosomal protein L32